MLNIKEIRSRLDQRKGKRDQLLLTIKQVMTKLKEIRIEHRASEKAGIIIRTISQQTQKQFQFRISELPKLALKGVFDDPYDFEVEFEIRRKKTEADFYFIKDGFRIDPSENTGLGAVDIAGTALRISLWSLQNPRNRPCIWLDEPFKHLKKPLPNLRALQMLSEVCKAQPDKNWPGIQIIMVSDERSSIEDIKEAADKVFEIEIKNHESTINLL